MGSVKPRGKNKRDTDKGIYINYYSWKYAWAKAMYVWLLRQV